MKEKNLSYPWKDPQMNMSGRSSGSGSYCPSHESTHSVYTQEACRVARPHSYKKHLLWTSENLWDLLGGNLYSSGVWIYDRKLPCHSQDECPFPTLWIRGACQTSFKSVNHFYSLPPLWNISHCLFKHPSVFGVSERRRQTGTSEYGGKFGPKITTGNIKFSRSPTDQKDETWQLLIQQVIQNPD